MKRSVCFFCIVVVFAIITFVSCDDKNNSLEEREKTVTIEKTIQEAVTELQAVETDEEAFAILNKYPSEVQETILAQCNAANEDRSEPEPWTGPAVDAVVAQYGRQASDIIAVQHMVMIRNDVPIDTFDAVITEDAWYYYHPDDESISSDPPASMAATTEMDIYGVDVTALKLNKYCWYIEWGIIFYLPVCFHEIAVSQFDGIIDAWAPNPSCAWNCNGGLCASYLCGSAWNGSGYLGWWDYNTCDDYWSKKVAKIVQKRWLHTWQLCHKKSDKEIAQSVRARIKF